MEGAAAVEKTEEELRKEIEELHRQQWEITERLRDPRGLRLGGATATPANGNRSGPRQQRGYVRVSSGDLEDQPASKRRLSSAVVKVEDGEIIEDVQLPHKDSTPQNSVASDPNKTKSQHPTRQESQRQPKLDFEAPATGYVPRVLPKEEDPKLVNRNKRMLGQLLGTLEKFRKEDMQLSGTEAFMRRSNSLQRAEQRAREESERLRQQEREQIAEKRRRDLTLRARVAAKAEEKKLELLFLRWSEHQKKLCNFLRTKTEPPIYYLPTKPLEGDATLAQQVQEQSFAEWKAARREELTDYQKQIGEQYVGNVEKELERWQNARKARKPNDNNNLNLLQETMDKELETHRLEHGPKTRKIPTGGDDDDVEDINVAEDDLMDDVLEVEDNTSRRIDESVKHNGIERP